MVDTVLDQVRNDDDACSLEALALVLVSSSGQCSGQS